MKIEKIWILAIIIFSLVFASFCNVVATNITKTLLDDKGDVIDEMTGDFVSKPNIDIRKLVATQEDNSVTLELTVENEIENRGSLDLFKLMLGVGDYTEEELLALLESSEFDFIGYYFIVATNDYGYMIFYANNDIFITESSVNVSIDIEFEVNLDTLSVFFDLLGESETIIDVSGGTMDYSGSFDDATSYFDEIYEVPLLVIADVTTLGEVNKKIDFIGEVIGGQQPYSFNWEFGDESTSTKQNTTHIYDNPGIYNYTFTVTDSSSPPVSESSSGNIEIVGDDDNGTPGFELIIAITAIGLIFLWKRKR